MALRIDIGALKPAKKLSDGRVRAEAHIARVGVQEYIDEHGKVRRELRTPEEVFDPESMDSFAQVPVTNTHPSERVTADNARQYMIGASGDRIQRDDDHLRAALMLADAETIDEMKRENKFEVSCGYTCDVIDGKGVHPVYGAYDARQTNIRGNHIAVNIHRARAGATARVRMDDATRLLADSVAFAKSRPGGRSIRLDQAAVTRVDSKLTNAVDGHQHLIDLQPDYGDRMSGSTSWAANEKGVDHAHAWVRNANGSITIAESSGHTHTILDLDSGSVTVQDDVVHHLPRGRKMAVSKKTTTKTDELTIEAAAEELRKAETRADAAEGSLSKETKRADEAEGRCESLEKEIETLKANRLDQKEIDKRDATIVELQKKLGKETSRADAAESPERFNGGVKRRVKIFQASTAILGQDLVTDAATDRELMCAVVEKLHGASIDKDADGKERSLDYVTARFDAAVEQFMESGETLDRLREMTRGKTVETPRDDARTAHASYVDRQQNAWKPKAAAAK